MSAAARSASASTAPAPDDTVQRLVLLMVRFDRALRSAAAGSDARDDVAAVLPLSVLCLLDLDGPARPSALCEVTGLTRSGVTKLVDRMVSAGVVRRSRGRVDGDGRAVLVSITGRGRGLVSRVTAALSGELPDLDILVKELGVLLHPS